MNEGDATKKRERKMLCEEKKRKCDVWKKKRKRGVRRKGKQKKKSEETIDVRNEWMNLMLEKKMWRDKIKENVMFEKMKTERKTEAR